MTSPCEEPAPLMPVRRLHNFVYCPRLFYLQWVEGIFVPNADTVQGSALHEKVDTPTKLKEEALADRHGTLRSPALSSEQLGLSGVADLLEEDENGERCLIDYKKGSPGKADDGSWQAKLNDRIQLAAYALLLKEQGIHVRKGSIYYAEIRKHITVELTEELKQQCMEYLAQARQVAESGICPPPLCSSRCFACSCYPVCLPFESRRWSTGQDAKSDAEEPLRPPMPAGDEGEILVIQNNQAYIGLRGGEITVKLDGEIISKHPIHQLHAVYLYGAIQTSAQCLQALMENSIPVSWFSPAGRFLGMAGGLPSSGIDARMGQYRLWSMPAKRLSIAAEIIRSKIHNQRVILMRNGKANGDTLAKLADCRDACMRQTSLASLRGIEGEAAALYFSAFGTMLKPDIPFDFNGRNRRPPKDAVNALLSLGYSVLSKELTGIAYSVGLDPFLGFFHSPRYGRPALALDMMEEFRPLITDSVVITLLNRGEITPGDFDDTTRGVLLKDSGRRQFWRAWTRRLDTEVTHPTFGYKMSYRRMLEVQMRQLWRFFRGDTNTFNGFTTR